MALIAGEPLDPHLIVETCPRCGAEKIIGRIEPGCGYGISLCDFCRRQAFLHRFFLHMDRVAAAFAGLRPFAGYSEWVLLRNRRFIKPLSVERQGRSTEGHQ